MGKSLLILASGRLGSTLLCAGSFSSVKIFLIQTELFLLQSPCRHTRTIFAGVPVFCIYLGLFVSGDRFVEREWKGLSWLYD